MDGQIKQLVHTLENTILNLPEGQEQMVWLVDFHGWGVKHSTPIKTIVKPFLDRRKEFSIFFVYTKNPKSRKLLDEYFENDILKDIFENPADYNHEEYTKLMEQDDVKSATDWKLGEDQPKECNFPIPSMIKLEDSSTQ